MRVLVLSECGVPFAGDSLIDEMKCFVLGVVGSDPNAFFEIVLPAKDKAWGDYDTSFLAHPQVRLHFVPMLPSNIVECTMMTRDLYEHFNLNRVKFFYDVVLNCRILAAPVLKKVLKSKYAKFAVDVPIFNHTGAVRGDQAQSALSLHGEDEVINEVFASLMDFTHVHSEEQKNMLLVNWRKYLAPSMVMRMMDRVFPSHFGFDFAPLDAVVQTRKKHDVPCLMFGGRWTDAKGFRTFATIVDRLYQSGLKFRAIATRPEAVSETDLTRLKSEHPPVEFFPSCNRVTFFKHAAEADFFIGDSVSEGFGRAYIEMAYAGAVGIWRKRPYVKHLVPDGHPYLVDGPEQMYAVTRKLLTDWDPVANDALACKIREWLQSKYDHRVNGAGFWNWMKQKTTEFYSGLKSEGTLGTLIRSVLDQLAPGPVKLSDVWTKMTEASKAHREFGAWGDIMSPFYLRRLILASGWIDTCNGLEVEVRKA